MGATKTAATTIAAFLMIAASVVACDSGDADGGRSGAGNGGSGSGAGNGAGGGSGDEALPGANGDPARAIVDSSRSGSAAACSGAGFTIGSFGPPAAPVLDGTAGSTVSCRVEQTGAAFTFEAAARTPGSGAFQVKGTLTPGAANIVEAVFEDASGVRTSYSGCSATFPEFGGVAPGRAWVLLACPAPTGSEAGCAMNAQVRFENCAQ